MTESSRHPKLPYSAGRRASGDRPSSRVRVYRRRASSDIYLSWMCAGTRQRRTLPEGTTPLQAIAICDRFATKRESEIQEVLQGGPTLAQLLEYYHESSVAEGWSDRHRANQNRYRRFWEEALGREYRVADLSPETIVRLSAEAAERREWAASTRRKYRGYLTAATGWATQSSWLLEHDPLGTVRLPEPESRSEISRPLYSARECHRLCTPDERVDFRVTVAANIGLETGRPIGAITQLRCGRDGDEAGDLQWRSDGRWLHFRPSTDKRRRDGWVPVSDRCAAIIRDALERPEVKKSPWLLPAGRLEQPVGVSGSPGYDDSRTQPISTRGLIRLLHEAEESLDMPALEGRAFHALRRFHLATALRRAHPDLRRVRHVTGTRPSREFSPLHETVGADELREYVEQRRQDITMQDGGTA